MPATDPSDPTETASACARELHDLPLHRTHGVEVPSADSEGVRTRWPFGEALVGNPRPVHTGVADVAVRSGGERYAVAPGVYELPGGGGRRAAGDERRADDGRRRDADGKRLDGGEEGIGGGDEA